MERYGFCYKIRFDIRNEVFMKLRTTVKQKIYIKANTISDYLNEKKFFFARFSAAMSSTVCLIIFKCNKYTYNIKIYLFF